MQHHSEIRFHQGTTMLFVDGKPVPPMAYQFMNSDPDITNNIPLPPFMPSEVQLSAMGSAGVRLYFIRMECNDPERVDELYEKLARTVRLLRRCVPDAYAMPWLIISPYDDFHNKYPNDVQVFDDGSTGGYASDCSRRMPDRSIPRHTHASLAWRHETAGWLRHLVRRIQSEPDILDAIVGYFFFPLHHEACYFHDFDHSKKLDDYSEPTRLAFRTYLAEKYAGRVSALRKAWHDDTVTFETAQLPRREARDFGTEGLFWDPSRSQQVMDYAEIRSHVWADTLEYFARAVKEESGHHAVVGSFWGYLIHNNTLWGGQSFFRRMMDSPFLDFWASPFTYVNKNPGMSVTSRFLSRSLQRHGKLFFAEVDTTTTSSSPTQFARQGMNYDDPAYDAELLKREFAFTLTEGLNGWWIDWPSGTAQYDEARLLPLMRRIQQVARESDGRALGSVSQIAALVEQNSLFAVPNSHSVLTSCAIEQPRIHELTYLGAPVDHYELHDVLDGRAPHDIYLFQNAYLLNRHEREAIVALRRACRAQVFMYAQGFLSPDAPTASAENVSALTGIRVRQVPGSQSSRIVLTEAAAQLGLTPGDEVGEFDKMVVGGMGFAQRGRVPYPVETQALDPVFVVDDPDAVVLGTYKETGLPAFAMKQTDGCILFYFGSTAFNTRLLRALCRFTGVHLFTDADCFVMANESYLGLHAAQDGPLTLRLPKARALREVYTGEVLPAADTFTIDVKKGQTRLYEYFD